MPDLSDHIDDVDDLPSNPFAGEREVSADHKSLRNEQAFTALYNQHWKKVLTYLVALTKSRGIAEELLQDIFTRIWIAWPLPAEIANMDAFLSKVAYNRAIDFFRLTARHRKLRQLIARELTKRQEPQADEHLLTEEAIRILHDAISQLSPQRKLIFTLSRDAGLSHEQIARHLHLSPNTVKKTLSNALHSIRSYLEEHGFEGSIILVYYLIR